MVAAVGVYFIAACSDGAGPTTSHLNVSISGGGSVTSAPVGIDCATGNTGTCAATFSSGASVTLASAPAPGWAFVGWSGDCTGTGSCVLGMTADRAVTATFQQLFRLSVSVAGNGAVTSSPTGISCTTANGGPCSADFLSGTVVILTPTPDAGSVFSGWSGAGISCPGTGSCAVAMDQARTVTATFVHPFTLTVGGAGTGTGTVASTPPGISCTSVAGASSGTCSANYTFGTVVTLSQAPGAGSAFAGWSGAGVTCSGTASCAVTMDQARSVTATFLYIATGPASLILTPKALIIDAGSAAGATVTVRDASGNTIADAPVTYVSRNVSVASVSATGSVSAVTRGQTVVVATALGGASPADSLLAVVAIPGGPVLMTDIAQFTYKTDTVFTAIVIMDMRASGESLGSATVSVTWNPSVLVYQAHANGGSGVSPTVNAANAASGSLTFTMADANGFSGRVELLTITFRAGSVAGSAGRLSLAASEVTGAGTFTDLLARTVAVSYPLATR